IQSSTENEPSMLANGFQQCQSDAVFSEARVCYSRRPSRALNCPVRVAVIQCSFGLSPEFSTPVEKTVENSGEARAKTVRVARRNEPLGRDSRAHRDEG